LSLLNIKPKLTLPASDKNIKKETHMKRYITISLLVLCFVVVMPNLYGQTCAPAGIYHVGPVSNAFNFVANPNPDSFNCWSHSGNVAFLTGLTSCSTNVTFTQSTNNAFEFGPALGTGPGGGPIANSFTQSIVIPSSDTRTNFQLSYFLDFDDPNDDLSNTFFVNVLDSTTNTFLYKSGTYNGSMPDLLCARRSSPAMTFPGTLAGHTITLIFKGIQADSNTHIRVFGFAFDGWN
jgi:hypothetical protein